MRGDGENCLSGEEAEDDLLYEITPTHHSWSQAADNADAAAYRVQVQGELPAVTPSLADRIIILLFHFINLFLAAIALKFRFGNELDSPSPLVPLAIRRHVLRTCLPVDVSFSPSGSVVSVLHPAFIEFLWVEDTGSNDKPICRSEKITLAEAILPRWEHQAWSADSRTLAITCGKSAQVFRILDGTKARRAGKAVWKVAELDCDIGRVVSVDGIASIAIRSSHTSVSPSSHELLLLTYTGALHRFCIPLDSEDAVAVIGSPFSSLSLGGIPSSMAFHNDTDLLAVTFSSTNNLPTALCTWSVNDTSPLLERVNGTPVPLSQRLRDVSLLSFLPNVVNTVSLCFSPDGRFVAGCTSAGNIVVWDVRAEYFCEVSLPSNPLDLVSHIRWWSASSLLTVSESGSLSIHHVDNRCKLRGTTSTVSFEPNSMVTHASNGVFFIIERKFLQRETAIVDPTAENDQSLSSLFEEANDILLAGKPPSGIASSSLYNVFSLLEFKSSTPEALYEIKLRRGEVSEAIELAEQYDLDTDPAYKAKWNSEDVTELSISSILSMVRDSEWVLKQCMKRPVAQADVLQLLHDYGISHSPSAQWRRRFEESAARLQTFLELCDERGESFCFLSFDSFRQTDLVSVCRDFAGQEKWTELAVVLDRHSKEESFDLLSIMSCAPLLSSPSSYCPLLYGKLGERDAELEKALITWNRDRAQEIDKATGQLSLSVSLIQYAVDNGIPLSNLLVELECFSRLVYESEIIDLNYTDLIENDPYDNLCMLLQDVTAETIVNRIKSIPEDWLKAEDLEKYMIEQLAPTRFECCSAIIFASRPLEGYRLEDRIIKDETDLLRISLQCMYSSERWTDMNVVYESLPQRDDSNTSVEYQSLQDQVDRIDLQLAVCETINAIRIPLPLSIFKPSLKDEDMLSCDQLIAKICSKAIDVKPPLSHRELGVLHRKLGDYLERLFGEGNADEWENAFTELLLSMEEFDFARFHIDQICKLRSISRSAKIIKRLLLKIANAACTANRVRIAFELAEELMDKNVKEAGSVCASLGMSDSSVLDNRQRTLLLSFAIFCYGENVADDLLEAWNNVQQDVLIEQANNRDLRRMIRVYTPDSAFATHDFSTIGRQCVITGDVNRFHDISSKIAEIGSAPSLIRASVGAAALHVLSAAGACDSAEARLRLLNGTHDELVVEARDSASSSASQIASEWLRILDDQERNVEQSLRGDNPSGVDESEETEIDVSGEIDANSNDVDQEEYCEMDHVIMEQQVVQEEEEHTDVTELPSANDDPVDGSGISVSITSDSLGERGGSETNEDESGWESWPEDVEEEQERMQTDAETGSVEDHQPDTVAADKDTDKGNTQIEPVRTSAQHASESDTIVHNDAESDRESEHVVLGHKPTNVQADAGEEDEETNTEVSSLEESSKEDMPSKDAISESTLDVRLANAVSESDFICVHQYVQSSPGLDISLSKANAMILRAMLLALNEKWPTHLHNCESEWKVDENDDVKVLHSLEGVFRWRWGISSSHQYLRDVVTKELSEFVASCSRKQFEWSDELIPCLLDAQKTADLVRHPLLLTSLAIFLQQNARWKNPNGTEVISYQSVCQPKDGIDAHGAPRVVSELVVGNNLAEACFIVNKVYQ